MKSRITLLPNAFKEGKNKPCGLLESEKPSDDGRKKYKIYLNGFNIIRADLTLDWAITYYLFAHYPFEIKFDLESENILVFIARVVFGYFDTKVKCKDLEKIIEIFKM